ncbi:LysR family transcriptional regulator, hydrogen peroxide-inducible genes activator [Spirosomataceae bacterium TFI 002]|nr:LysR family transcriptional regulator, hydrogen peroxide-inducible genes activator [Spirosomataceae bacterium TFI 002]
MNLQQLEYILAVDKHRHFARAADACHVTQPTLSMMIHKLEDEYEIKIFDRTRQPVIPTEVGEKLIIQARKILQEAERFGEICIDMKENIRGELRIGIIPTIAPYLLPLFVSSFTQKYPEVLLKINELTTESILKQLENGSLDLGILVPLDNEQSWKVTPLYVEPFLVYSARSFEKNFVLAEEIDVNDLLLLEEGHCFRSQILKLCELRNKDSQRVQYNSGSLETLRNLVDQQLGITILPKLATLHFDEKQKSKLREFREPQPVRKVAILTKRDYIKEKLITALKNEIVLNLPTELTIENSIVVPLEL